MHLSEQKVEDLSRKIVGALLDQDLVDFDFPETRLIVDLEKFILQELRIEDQIHEEALARLATYSRRIEEGSSEWQILLQKAKEEIARKRGYVL